MVLEKMYIFDQRITLKDRELMESYLDGFDYKTSGLSYTSLFMWRDINMFSWEMIGDYLCIAGVDNYDIAEDNPFLFPPLTCTGAYEPESLRRTILEAKKRFEAKSKTFVLKLVPFHMLEIFTRSIPGGFAEADRPNFDYVYNTKDLIELKGRAYHSKKNHLNYFKSNYDYKYEEMTPGMAEDAMAFIRDFNERKSPENLNERELLEYEERAMHDVFVNLDKVGYLSGAITIGGKIEALSIGGRLGRKTVTVHVEKANTEYRGLYQAINNEFCRAMAKDFKLINREEDMGIPGLRKAKLSYHPAKFVEKYTILLK
jgi:hypothetical protein